jgi:tRNA (guanine-N7-)-methyltransferase
MAELKQQVIQPRNIRSFVRRQGRITVGQARALEKHWEHYGLELARGEINPARVFGRKAPLIVEIGFGDGHSLLQMAQSCPGQDYIGIEVHRPGVGGLINNAVASETRNIRVYCADAVEVLNRCIPDQSLDGVQLFFPDPWHKKRHHKRRLLQPPFAQVIRRKLVGGGYFHMATDWENYAEHMMDVMSGVEGFENKAGDGNYSSRPDYRPETRFEKRGQRLGHGVRDLIFVGA